MAELPEDVLYKVFCFVGDSQELLACERTCRVFRKVLEDDAIWGYCHEVCKPKKKYMSVRPRSEDLLTLFPPSSNREKAFTLRAYEQCLQWGQSTKPVTLGVLGVSGWKALVQSAISEYLPANLGACRHSFPIRGDTSAVLLEILETCLVAQLKRAEKIAVHSAHRTSGPKTTHPTVLVSDFMLQDEMHQFAETSERCNLVGNIEESSYERATIDLDLVSRFPAHVTSQQKFQIVRRLAYRAGVVKLEDELFKLVWSTLLKVMLLLLKPACLFLVDRAPPTPDDGKQILPKHRFGVETMREIPPLPELGQADGCPNCHGQGVIHWIVPKQVEDAGKQLGIPARVYGNEWHIDETANESVLTEKELAKSKYRLKREDGLAQLERLLEDYRSPAEAASRVQAIMQLLGDMGQKDGEGGDDEKDESSSESSGESEDDDGSESSDDDWDLYVDAREEEESSSESSSGSEDDDESYIDEGEWTDDDLDLYVNEPDVSGLQSTLNQPRHRGCNVDNTFTW